MNKIIVTGIIAVICISCISFVKVKYEFFDKASQANLAEIYAGKIAVDRGSGKIKEFGRKMIADHKAAQLELVNLSKTEHIEFNSSQEIGQKTRLDSLKNRSGKAFDDAYIKIELADHIASLAFYSDEAEKGVDPRVKEYAGKYMPLLKAHLEMFKGDSSAMKMSVDSGKAKKNK